MQGNKGRIGWVFAFLLVGVLSIGAMCAEMSVLRVRMVADIVNLDPPHLHTAADRLVLQQVVEGLVQFDWRQEAPFPATPRIAKSYEISEDGREITFYINEGIMFHRGYGELTAEDVVFSLKRHMDPAVASKVAPQFAEVAEIEATGPYTVKVSLESPSALTLLQNLAWQAAGMVISKKATEELGDKIERFPIGTGPYYFEEWSPGISVILKRFPDYWGAPDWGFGSPAFDEVHCLIIPEDMLALDALETGEIDIVGLVKKGSVTRAEQIEGISLQAAIGGSWQHHVFFNHKKAPMNDVRVRKALAHALDLKTIADRLGPMQKYYPSPFNEVCFSSSDEFWVYEYNIEKAKELLTEAGYPNGFTMQFIYPKIYMYEDVVLEVARYWSEVGIDVELQVIEYGVYYKTIHEFEHDVCLWSMTRFAPFLYAQAYLSGTPWNHFAYSNPALDELIAVASAEPDEARAKELWRRVQRAIVNDVVGIYPALQVAWAAIADRVEGIIVIPFSTLVDLAAARPTH